MKRTAIIVGTLAIVAIAAALPPARSAEFAAAGAAPVLRGRLILPSAFHRTKDVAAASQAVAESRADSAGVRRCHVPVEPTTAHRQN